MLVYVAAAVSRWDIMRHAGQPTVNEPGVCGLLACPEDPLVRLLVSDDRAHDWLASLLPDICAGFITTLAPAVRCGELVNSQPGWAATPMTAMVCRELHTVPDIALPSALTFRPVRRLDSDDRNGVPLEAAVAAAMRADPEFDDEPEQFADYLRSLPPSITLFAAVDRHGTVRATSGSGVHGEQATVLFVSTDPAWRGRGIGHAATAAALNAARARGARQVCLDATDIAVSIYQRLGFEAVCRIEQFYRAA